MGKKTDTDPLLKKIDQLLQAMHEREQATNKLIERADSIFSLFEEASKHVAEAQSTEEKIRTLSIKLEALLDQNKTIAQRLILLEKYVRGKTRLEPALGTIKTQSFSSP